MAGAVRIGLVADTHGVLHPGAEAALAGVYRILHAGDVGGAAVLDRLARVAPVWAVRGNVDPPGSLPDERVVEVAGRRILLLHAFPGPRGYETDPARLAPAVRARLEADRIDVVVFGHSHRALVRRDGAVLFVNPGGGGRKRFTLPRSVATLDLSGPVPDAAIVYLDR